MMFFLAIACQAVNRYQIDPTKLPPGVYLCDQNMTPERWLAFSLAMAGVAFCLFFLAVNAAMEGAMLKVSESRPIVNISPRLSSSRPILHTANFSFYPIAVGLAISAIHQFNLYGIEVSAMMLGLVLFMLIFCRAIPATFAVRKPEVTLRRWGGLVSGELWFFTPLHRLVEWCTRPFVPSPQ